MSRSVRHRLDGIELKPLKHGEASAASARKTVSPDPDVRKNLSPDRCEHGDLIAKALEQAHITRGQAAGYMGISEGLLSRQIENIDNQHLSWQRLFKLPDVFWRELLFLTIERRKLAKIRRRATFELSA